MSDIYNAGGFERRRITRLVMESLEVAFHLCNTYTEQYSLTKIFDIVNSIMPTAYILNTGYWIFYLSYGGQSVCICRRFGLCCPHQLSDNHWINMDSTPETEVTPFSSTQLGQYWPVDYNIHVTPMINDALRSYDVLIKMTVKSCNVQGVAATANPTGFIVCTEIRYLMTPEYYPHETKIVHFTPHPLNHSIYGMYFLTLHTYFDTYVCQSQFFYKNTIITSMHPQLTIIPFGGTFSPYHNYPHNLHNAFNLSVLNKVNISIHNDNKHYEITDESRSSFNQDNDVVSYYPTQNNFDRFWGMSYDYYTKSLTGQSDESLDNQHKQKRRRGKYNGAPVGTRLSKDKHFTLSENLPTQSNEFLEKDHKPNEIYSQSGFFSRFNDAGFELQQNQGVKKKDMKMLKYKSITDGESFTLPKIMIENIQDTDEYFEDISDIIKNDLENGSKKNIKKEHEPVSAEEELFDLTKSPTPTAEED